MAKKNSVFITNALARDVKEVFGGIACFHSNDPEKYATLYLGGKLGNPVLTGKDKHLKSKQNMVGIYNAKQVVKLDMAPKF